MRKQRNFSVESRVQWMNGDKKARDQPALKWKSRWRVVTWDSRAFSAPLPKVSPEHCFHGIYSSQSLYIYLVCVFVCVCLCLCVWEKKEAWVSLYSLRPKEVLLWNASWIVVMTFFFSCWEPALTSTWSYLDCVSWFWKQWFMPFPIKLHRGLRVKKGDWWPQRNLASMNFFQGLGHIFHQSWCACFVKIKAKLLFIWNARNI